MPASLAVSPAAAQGALHAQDAATAAATTTTQAGAAGATSYTPDKQQPPNEHRVISNNSTSTRISGGEGVCGSGGGGGGVRRKRQGSGGGGRRAGGSDNGDHRGSGSCVYEQPSQGSTGAVEGLAGASSTSSSSTTVSNGTGSSSDRRSESAPGKAKSKKSKSPTSVGNVDVGAANPTAAVTAFGEAPAQLLAAAGDVDSDRIEGGRDDSELPGAIGGGMGTPSEGGGGGGGAIMAQRAVRGGGGKVAPGGGGRPPGASAHKAGAGGGGKSLPDRIRACRSVEELLALYDTAQREASAAARRNASEAGAAAAAAGLAAGAAAGLPAATVWMFLAAAGELVAGWRARIPAGYRTARLREAREMRAQLSRLLSESCAVVLWAERLGPPKVCLLLSLMVVAGGRHRGAEQHLGLLAEDSLNSLEQYSSGEVALAASSFARLRYYPGKGWLDTLVEATSGNQLARWRPIDLGFLIWALAKWKAKYGTRGPVGVPAAWLEEYYQAFEGCGERVTERELAMVCWAVGVLAVEGGPRPPGSFTNRLMMEVQVRLPSLGNQGLAHVAWGLCCCDVKPPKFWLRDFTGAAKAAMPYAGNGLSFSNLLWALAMWQGELHPGEQLLAEACKHSARWLHTLDFRGLAVLLLALSDLGHTPPLEWTANSLRSHSAAPPSGDGAAVKTPRRALRSR
ncbi:hypothetical protein VOLCADRAFT_96172 [Volvox carteri f. nagariensis]|uniref:Tbc2 translation factor, chloroplastic n=1 Tax=Volvox carteri f. nagariensis TaxID=3068 RepID=D8U9E5_VOLCA|nr:uncharacterized protein VOLCADRAFT_96172 [Volvox carteri f. nagariensis]EFJ43627.1 hypothetical protein VOLCADRAFT_96172 [Volvox carteri f. nagariensis]|eukprot:XP_002955327.1 hypothetical protein VOLCADRAFT_96172 [Volvox carteri f. nagariensis]